MELAKLVEKLKSGATGSSKAKKSSRRRRRRRQIKKSAASLAETHAETEAEAEDEADADEYMVQRKEAVETRLVQLRAEATEFEQKLKRLAEVEEAVDKKLADSDAQIAAA